MTRRLSLVRSTAPECSSGGLKIGMGSIDASLPLGGLVVKSNKRAAMLSAQGSAGNLADMTASPSDEDRVPVTACSSDDVHALAN